MSKGGLPKPTRRIDGPSSNLLLLGGAGPLRRPTFPNQEAQRRSRKKADKCAGSYSGLYLKPLIAPHEVEMDQRAVDSDLKKGRDTECLGLFLAFLLKKGHGHGRK